MTTVPPATRASALEVSGASLHHEVRGAGPLIVLVGAPMGAAAFAALADVLASDHTVLTCDPRGSGRSRITGQEADSPPELRARDLAALVDHVDAGPATVLGSSGGAVTALALVQSRPDQVSRVVAHEPPLVELLPDREALHTGTQAYCTAYLAGDVVGAWTAFFDQANIAVPPEVVQEMFGGRRDPRDVADERFWFAHELRPTTRWCPDLPALRASSATISVGIGAGSTGQICDLTSRALAEALGVEPLIFPGDHTGFVDDPEAFADRLREVLDA